MTELQQQQQPAPLQPQQMQQPAPLQPQQMQQPTPPQPQQQPAPTQPAPPQPQPSMITFNTTAPEPTQVTQPLQPVNGSYQSIIEQQQAQIAALIQQNNNLNAQVTQMVQNGAQFGQVQQAQQVQQPQQPMQPAQYPNVYQPADLQAHPLSTFNPASLANDEDYSLESLASEIGKRDNNG